MVIAKVMRGISEKYIMIVALRPGGERSEGSSAIIKH